MGNIVDLGSHCCSNNQVVNQSWFDATLIGMIVVNVTKKVTTQQVREWLAPHFLSYGVVFFLTLCPFPSHFHDPNQNLDIFTQGTGLPICSLFLETSIYPRNDLCIYLQFGASTMNFFSRIITQTAVTNMKLNKRITEIIF